MEMISDEDCLVTKKHGRKTIHASQNTDRALFKKLLQLETTVGSMRRILSQHGNMNRTANSRLCYMCRRKGHEAKDCAISVRSSSDQDKSRIVPGRVRSGACDSKMKAEQRIGRSYRRGNMKKAETRRFLSLKQRKGISWAERTMASSIETPTSQAPPVGLIPKLEVPASVGLPSGANSRDSSVNREKLSSVNREKSRFFYFRPWNQNPERMKNLSKGDLQKVIPRPDELSALSRHDSSLGVSVEESKEIEIPTRLSIPRRNIDEKGDHFDCKPRQRKEKSFETVDSLVDGQPGDGRFCGSNMSSNLIVPLNDEGLDGRFMKEYDIRQQSIKKMIEESNQNREMVDDQGQGCHDEEDYSNDEHSVDNFGWSKSRSEPIIPIADVEHRSIEEELEEIPLGIQKRFPFLCEKNQDDSIMNEKKEMNEDDSKSDGKNSDVGATKFSNSSDSSFRSQEIWKEHGKKVSVTLSSEEEVCSTNAKNSDGSDSGIDGSGHFEEEFSNIQTANEEDQQDSECIEHDDVYPSDFEDDYPLDFVSDNANSEYDYDSSESL